MEDFLTKSVQSLPGKPEGQNRLYAGINMATPASRIQTYINGYDGKVEKTIMSVLEMAVTCQGSDPAPRKPPRTTRCATRVRASWT